MPINSTDAVRHVGSPPTRESEARPRPPQPSAGEALNEYDGWSAELRHRIRTHQGTSPLAVGIAPSAPRAGATAAQAEAAGALERVQTVMGYMLANSTRVEGILPNLDAEEVGLVMRAAQIEHEALASTTAKAHFVELLRNDATSRRIELMTQRFAPEREEHAAARAYLAWLRSVAGR